MFLALSAFALFKEWLTLRGLSSCFSFSYLVLLMAFFLSTYINKVDKKGRVSVPSGFRNELKGESFDGIVLCESVINNCIEGYPFSKIEELSKAIDCSFEPFSMERDAFTTSILGASVQLPFDSEGRIIMPKTISQFLGIDESVLFVGKGQKFEIWHPDHFVLHLEKAKKIAMESRSMLKISPVS